MRYGFALPQIGPVGSREAIITVASRAEEMGFDSLWVTERLLYALKAESPYAGRFTEWPAVYKHSIEPLHTLTFAAAHTSRLTLGTSAIVAGNHQPLHLARSAAAIDIFSEGRLRLGLSVGWAADEHKAVGTDMATRAARMDEFIAALKTIWTQDTVSFSGDFFQIPESTIQPKPVQKPHPPILIGGHAEASLRRAATLGDGWNPVVFMPAADLKQRIATLRELTREAGRDADAMQVVGRVNFKLTDEPEPEGRRPFTGTPEQLGEDVAAFGETGVNELFFDPTSIHGPQTLDDYLAVMDTVRGLLD